LFTGLRFREKKFGGREKYQKNLLLSLEEKVMQQKQLSPSLLLRALRADDFSLFAHLRVCQREFRKNFSTVKKRIERKEIEKRKILLRKFLLRDRKIFLFLPFIHRN